MLLAIGWILVAAAAFALGSNLSALSRAPVDLRRLLGNSEELASIMLTCGPGEMNEEAASLNPPMGFGAFIYAWDIAHIKSLRAFERVLVVMGMLDLGAAYFISLPCFLTAVALLGLPRLFPIQQSAKFNNVKHVHAIMLSVIKWNSTDHAACETYCTKENPRFDVLYKVVTTMPAR